MYLWCGRWLGISKTGYARPAKTRGTNPATPTLDVLNSSCCYPSSSQKDSLRRQQAVLLGSTVGLGTGGSFQQEPSQQPTAQQSDPHTTSIRQQLLNPALLK